MQTQMEAYSWQNLRKVKIQLVFLKKTVSIYQYFFSVQKIYSVSFATLCQIVSDDCCNSMKQAVIHMTKGRVQNKKTENIMNLALFPFGPSLHPKIVKKVIVKIGHSLDTLPP